VIVTVEPTSLPSSSSSSSSCPAIVSFPPCHHPPSWHPTSFTTTSIPTRPFYLHSSLNSSVAEELTDLQVPDREEWERWVARINERLDDLRYVSGEVTPRPLSPDERMAAEAAEGAKPVVRKEGPLFSR
jgi:hypothetical protein